MKKCYDQIKKNSKKKFWGLLMVLVLLSLGSFPAILVGILKLSNYCECLSALVIKDGINDWFAFWGSYSGTCATVILGCLTFRLTYKLDNLNSEMQHMQTKLSVAQNMPNFVCKNILLYSIGNGDWPHEIISYRNNLDSNYTFEIEMSPAFPPYFSIELEKIKIRTESFSSHDESDEYKLKKENYAIRNDNETVKIILNMPEELEDEMEIWYNRYLYDTLGQSGEKLLSDICICVLCKDVLMPKEIGKKNTEKNDLADVRFWMRFTVKNSGKNRDGNGVKFDIISRQFEA